ncbi:response regulator [Pseudoruegeria sp. HB172150]|uniref:response regulator n=1 Tax=Pseudoruegeria sp. HB172150 TaxID=2721164 RepID=UPI0015566569|nr:response regulator [Pseudoruegeria sp. HB172150]
MTDLNKILHVDDDEDVRVITEMALALGGGLELKQCDSGKSAIEACMTYDPDLLLLDLMMPHMTGEEAWDEIRKIPGKENIAAVFLTAKADAATTERILSKGALGVIPKPFDPMQLFSKVQELWERSGR